MNTRIRYVTSNAAGELTSLRIFRDDSGREYKSRLFVGGLSGAIIDAADESIVDTVVGTSSHQTKIALKEALTKLGVAFGDETRQRSGDDI